VSDIATLPPASSTTCPLARLNTAELARRQSAIQRAIDRARSTYPLAAENLQRWLNNPGARRDIRLSEFNFLDNDSGLPGFLLRTHRPVIARGLERRLALPGTDATSLHPPGREQVLDWQDSVRANMWRPDRLRGAVAAPSLERDLSIALGGYTVHSRVRARARPGVRTSGGVRQVVEVVSWKVQICDRFDWIVGSRSGQCISAAAPIVIPPGVRVPPVPQGAGTVTTLLGQTVVVFNDQWMHEVEYSGGARSYDIFSEVFDAPAGVRAAFESINGTIRP
jgi:hypothetical protein